MAYVIGFGTFTDIESNVPEPNIRPLDGDLRQVRLIDPEQDDCYADKCSGNSRDGQFYNIGRPDGYAGTESDLHQKEEYDEFIDRFISSMIKTCGNRSERGLLSMSSMRLGRYPARSSVLPVLEMCNARMKSS
jgi:hypothetical protein